MVCVACAGHMHQQLRGTGQRDMAAIDAATGTVHLNAAVVPRVRTLPARHPGAAAQSPWGTVNEAAPGAAGGAELCSDGGDGWGFAGSGRARGAPRPARHFVTVELRDGAAVCASNVWLARGEPTGLAVGKEWSSRSGNGVGPGSDTLDGGWHVVRKEPLLRSAASGVPGRLVRSVWRASLREWEPVVSPGAPAQVGGAHSSSMAAHSTGVAGSLEL